MEDVAFDATVAIQSLKVHQANCQTQNDSGFLEHCQLKREKDWENSCNVYHGRGSHNFHGRFCSCDQPYCEDEAEPRTMFQCLECQDWYHDSCIGTIPDPELFDEFICAGCAKDFPVYSGFPRDANGLFPDENMNTCLSTTVSVIGDAPIFLKPEWRTRLCSCPGCDTILSKYPHLKSAPEMWEPEPDNDNVITSRVTEKLTKDKVLLDNTLVAMEKMKQKMKEFMQTAGSDGRIITREDIVQYFG